MNNWLDISYLQRGNERQRKGYHALTELNILPLLKDFDPVLVGTIPIGVDVESSDLDIICNVSCIVGFQKIIQSFFQKFEGFKDYSEEHLYVANFLYSRFEIEIYACPIPSVEQNAYRHMVIESRILRIAGEKFCTEIINLKKNGYKTEPAFGKLLKLDNAYDDLLLLGDMTDKELTFFVSDKYTPD